MTSIEGFPEPEVIKPWEEISLAQMREVGVIASFSDIDKVDDFEVRLASEMEIGVASGLEPDMLRRMNEINIGRLALSLEKGKLARISDRFKINPIQAAYGLTHISARLAESVTIAGRRPHEQKQLRMQLGLNNDADDVIYKSAIVYSAALEEKHTEEIEGYCGLRVDYAAKLSGGAPRIVRFTIDDLKLVEAREDLYPKRYPKQKVD